MIKKKKQKDAMELIKGGVGIGYASSLPGGSAGAGVSKAYGRAGGVLGTSMTLDAIDKLRRNKRR